MTGSFVIESDGSSDESREKADAARDVNSLQQTGYVSEPKYLLLCTYRPTKDG